MHIVCRGLLHVLEGSSMHGTSFGHSSYETYTFALHSDPRGSRTAISFRDFCKVAAGFLTAGILGCKAPEYKARERIHRGIADPRLLAIPPSWGRVADPNLNWAAV